MDEKNGKVNENDLNKLEKIGLKKISNETHIVISNLKAIINKEFDKLNRTKAIGFAKILEREYKLDLSNWKKEYDDYIKQKNIDEQKELFVSVKNEGEEEKENRFFLIIAAVALIIIAYGTYYFFNNYQNTISNENPKKETSDNVIKEQKAPIKEKAGTNITENEQNRTLLLPKENNETNQSSDINISKTDTEKNSSKENNLTIKSFTIIPRSKLWVGVIFLDDFSKKQFLTDGNITLDPSKDFLLITGHGKFDIYIGEQKYHYDDGGKLRLLFKDKTLDTIDSEMFKTLNRGKAW